MNLMELKNTSQTRKVRNKYKIDDEPHRMSQFEWRGTLNEGELFVVIKYTLGAIKIKFAETEYELNNISYIYVAQHTRPLAFLYNEREIDIDEIITFLQWK